MYKEGDLVYNLGGMALGKFCEFCQMAHTGPCSHPGRMRNDLLERAIDAFLTDATLLPAENYAAWIEFVNEWVTTFSKLKDA
jgi:hypothetical protein